jgi:hypothetical protein
MICMLADRKLLGAKLYAFRMLSSVHEALS